MVIVRAIERRLGKYVQETQHIAPTTGLAIDDMNRHSPITLIRQSDPSALKSLLQKHSDLSIGGPTWSVEFKISYRED